MTESDLLVGAQGRATPSASPGVTPVACGRFAPTPSGTLHVGSLSTAVGSWLRIRHQRGCWRVRIDDLDRVRCPTGTAERILEQLQCYGLYWDGEPVYQSQHRSDYAAALEALKQAGSVYNCNCSRAALRERRTDVLGYDRSCLHQPPAATAGPFALRLRLPATLPAFDDLQRGLVQPAAAALGDPVLQRRDGVFGYALACAVDEGLMGITEVIRGEDLLQETFAQRVILERLSFPLPRYGHLPLRVDASGRKLSKQNHAAALPTEAAGRAEAMLTVLAALGYDTALAGRESDLSDLLRWAAAQALPPALR
jgi:glutamyl-Q tRNA(Asp) synthetase